MMRVILIFGCIAGALAIGGAILGTAVAGSTHLLALEWLGYLVMIAALSLVFVGVKRLRDEAFGGVIRFRRAFGAGLGIALVASFVYVAVWEVYLAATDHAFVDAYAATVLEREAERGATEAELEAVRGEMGAMAARYQRVPSRLAITFLEIFPIGIAVALVSAAVLRKPRVPPPDPGNPAVAS